MGTLQPTTYYRFKPHCINTTDDIKLDSPKKVQIYLQEHDGKISIPVKKSLLGKKLVFHLIKAEEITHIDPS